MVDGIYTRVGASDDLASGQSTFMVEMSEVAQILQSATENSLLILDEIGRGTSTFDGMSIARAVIEHIANRRKLGAKTLFATHYHELTELEQSFFNIKITTLPSRKTATRFTSCAASCAAAPTTATASTSPAWRASRRRSSSAPSRF